MDNNNIQINNIHKLFFQDYYNDINWEFVVPSPNNNGNNNGNNNISRDNSKTISANNDKILNSKLVKVTNEAWEKNKNKMGFSLKVIYPGLVTGTGLVHDSKKLEGGYNLGMHFDYTRGMPIVYGSSVKGVLRQYFKEFLEEGDDNFKEALFEEIFDGKKNGECISIYERDIFFDAVIEFGTNNVFLANDSITPHTQGALKNPVPITMLKIASGCTLQFRFLLHKTEIKGKEFTADKKLSIFKEILTTVGIGAKANVGYGQLKEVQPSQR